MSLAPSDRIEKLNLLYRHFWYSCITRGFRRIKENDFSVLAVAAFVFVAVALAMTQRGEMAQWAAHKVLNTDSKHKIASRQRGAFRANAGTLPHPSTMDWSHALPLHRSY